MVEICSKTQYFGRGERMCATEKYACMRKRFFRYIEAYLFYYFPPYTRVRRRRLAKLAVSSQLKKNMRLACVVLRSLVLVCLFPFAFVCSPSQLELVHEQTEEALDPRHQEANQISEGFLRGELQQRVHHPDLIITLGPRHLWDLHCWSNRICVFDQMKKAP